jgi:hypothetical protein
MEIRAGHLLWLFRVFRPISIVELGCMGGLRGRLHILHIPQRLVRAHLRLVQLEARRHLSHSLVGSVGKPSLLLHGTVGPLRVDIAYITTLTDRMLKDAWRL